MKTRRLVLSVIGGAAISMVAAPVAQADTHFDFLPPEISNSIPAEWTDALNMTPPAAPDVAPLEHQVQDNPIGPVGPQDYQPYHGNPESHVPPEAGPDHGAPFLAPEIGPFGGMFGGPFLEPGIFGGFGEGFGFGPGFGGFGLGPFGIF
ncbi:hypothetical protein BFN03_11950 [Rhodococcus sp. WMMA185]|uniref:hypothetical protein n=1 Tax=Rhodococcus sp. WMMA185 TaxID=679318 RepID=UPI0008783F87|nr:hypothetical protein [Rhodococcus sp. WMMA185]AOW93123.1 hypothetical protein BFN03_11950 [Rhodococcus sp. WMMA185]